MTTLMWRYKTVLEPGSASLVGPVIPHGILSYPDHKAGHQSYPGGECDGTRSYRLYFRVLENFYKFITSI